MARIFKTPFSAQGDIEQVPEAPQGDGSVSFTNGFGYDYEREYDDPAAKDVRREIMNGLFYDVTEVIGEIQLSGIAKWSADAEPYPAGAVVWHDSVAWQSRVNNNTTTPSEGESWTAVATAASVGNAYVPLTRTITAGTGLSGGGNLSANRTLSVNYGTASGTAAQGNDSRIVNAVPNSRTISAGTGLSGGGSLATNRTLSVNYGTTAGTAAQGDDSRIVNSVQTSGNQTIAGVKTFSSFPVTPSAAPTGNYQAANKKYVDDNSIGVGQTWQDVTTTRAINTTYTNTTGRPIVMMINITQGSAGRGTLFVSGVELCNNYQQSSGEMSTFTVIVPTGATYRYEVTAGAQTINRWVILQ